MPYLRLKNIIKGKSLYSIKERNVRLWQQLKHTELFIIHIVDVQKLLLFTQTVQQKKI